MPRKEYPLQQLSHFLPAGSFELIAGYLHEHKVHLTITRERRTVLGDYRHALRDRNHRISINGNLNPYAFLITLVHELAHLVTFETHGHRVSAHGKEWKQLYRVLLQQFLGRQIFPADVEQALLRSLHNLPASSCADEPLMRILRNHDHPDDRGIMVEELPEGALFAIDGGRIFKKGKKLRKRYQCKEVATGKLYLFSGLYEVEQASA
ncbi:SprT-like domain-containing protein [Flavihumibacter profundi]|uniref:SprT-like domain-containing protein n=1 Tax=Flavihumibacter profundi TaxID=2716883 RepID=UPI001CC42491|nr:SprT-like domain-containing protein [Flavihumibacter profundi]MBZ5856723.1 SprT-like domain-containing protein [Flavihumibacter profundi]